MQQSLILTRLNVRAFSLGCNLYLKKHRIVAKVYELIKICDRLKEKIKQPKETQV